MDAGIDGGIISNISSLLLLTLAANPGMYAHLQNATLVQDVNAVDTLEARAWLCSSLLARPSSLLRPACCRTPWKCSSRPLTYSTSLRCALVLLADDHFVMTSHASLGCCASPASCAAASMGFNILR